MSKIVKIPGSGRTSSAIKSGESPFRAGMPPIPPVMMMLLMTAVLSTALPVFADQIGDSRRVTFHGTLKKKPCHISNDRDINVHFGKVGTKKVDGLRYMQTVPYSVSCDEIEPAWVLTLTVKGIPVGFEKTALKTNANGLGIRMLQNGIPLEINKPLPINYADLPNLQAVPVQQEGVPLPEKDFNVTATLMAEFQ